MILAVFLSISFARPIHIESFITKENLSGMDDSSYLQYDDGSPAWMSGSGLYRGVWFNTDDFLPGMSGFLVDFSEYWMYHHPAIPWDIGDFYAEVWNGDYMAPLVQLNSTRVTAVHFAPVYVYYNPPLAAESNFWVFENTELSSNGSPFMMGDSTPPAVDHSFYSDDFFVWEPWSDGTNTGDFLVRCGGEFPTRLVNLTWGAIKAVF